MSLYLKYRPQGFADLVGQEHVRQVLQNAFRKDRVSHAYLFCGPRGTGKTSTARILAKALNCENFDTKKSEPCNECASCKAIAEGSLIDIIEIDAASNRGIDEIRELRDTIKFAPSQAKNKVYIIDEVHMLTKEAFNALLKTLEEPPENVYFVLATTEVHKIPETIISRCQRFDFRRISEKDIAERLAHIASSEKVEANMDALEIIGRYVDGGLRDAIGVFEQMAMQGKIEAEDVTKVLGSTSMNTVEEFVDLLLAGQSAEAIKLIHDLYENGVYMGQLAKDMVLAMRKKLLASVETNDLATQSGVIKLLSIWQEISESFKNCDIPQLPLEVMALRANNGLIKEATKPKPVKEPTATKKVTEEKIAAEKKPAKKPVVKDEPKAKNEKPEVKTEAPKSKEEPETEVAKFEGDIEKAWQEMLKNINQPALRISLKQGKLKQISGDKFSVSFSSSFHYEAVNQTENLNLAEVALAEVIGAKVKIEAEMGPVHKAPEFEMPEPEEAPEPKKVEEKPEKSEKKHTPTETNQELIDEALALFEGEIVTE